MRGLQDLDANQMMSLLASIRELADVTGTDDFHQHVVNTTAHLLPDEWIASESYDKDTFARLGGVVSPVIPPAVLEWYFACAQEHPLLDRFQETDGRRGAETWTSILGAPKGHEDTTLWHEFFRPLDIAQQAAVWWNSPPGLLHVFVFSRDGAYSDADMGMLNALRPHLINAHSNWLTCQELKHDPQWQRDGLEAMGCALVHLNQQGRVQQWTRRAEEILQQHFSNTSRQAGQLPPALARWVKAVLPEDPNDFIAPPPYQGLRDDDHGRAAIAVRLARSPRDGGYLLVLGEQRGLPAPAELQTRFGLTPQRAKVIHLLAQGMSNPQIAQTLGLSTGTIRKHLEHAYLTLGVSSRTEALAKISQHS